jgi:hypothetical protein
MQRKNTTFRAATQNNVAAALAYAVKTEQLKYPEDFIFQLTKQEKDEVVANCDHLTSLKFSPSLPHVFTEHGAIMAATVLNSKRAAETSVFVVRAFVRLRRLLVTHKVLAQQLDELEQRVLNHDEALKSVVVAIRELIDPSREQNKGRIGFAPPNPQSKPHSIARISTG